MGSGEKNLNGQSLEQASDSLLTEAERLIWSLLDEEIEEEETRHLEKLLKENAQVRQRYIDCLQMHTDLKEHFGSSSQPDLKENISSPVLGQLGDIRPGTDSLPPVQD